MKNFIFILAIAILGIVSCAEKDSTYVKPLSVSSDKNSSIMELPSAHSVSADTAKAWVKNYKDWLDIHNAARVQQTQKDGRVAEIPNSRSVWFSVEQLEKMINEIKAEKGDGIRFYYASYGKMESFVDSCTKTPYNYSYLNTLLMVPTKKDNCYHRDYYSSSNSVTTMDIENKGEICPPPADCHIIGASLIDE